MKRVAFYIRVSTSKQGTINQHRELTGCRWTTLLTKMQFVPCGLSL
jgi:DNA invertase Pin-like site-specific DNA recombinase